MPFTFMTDDDVAAEIAEVSILPLSYGIEGAARLAVTALGTLAAAKVQEAGVGTLDPVVVGLLNDLSDRLAARTWPTLAEQLDVDRMQILGQAVRPRLVTGHRGPTWCPAPPPDPEADATWLIDLLSPRAQQLAGEVLHRIVTRLNAVRDRAAPGTAEEGRLHQISECVALIACAKVQLALWGNGTIAATFEQLATTHAQAVLAANHLEGFNAT